MSDPYDPAPPEESSRLWRIFLPVGIITLGAVVYAGMVTMRTPTERHQRVYLGPLVESMVAPETSLKVMVEVQGTVRPATEIDIIPQVSGVVVWKSPRLESGGFVKRGDLLLQIDPRDYQLAVEAAQAEVAQNQYALEVVRGEAEIARQEWELIQGNAAKSTPLALHIPQLRAAEARLQAAKARAGESFLRLERTEFYAPFDGRVRRANLDRGQFVVAGQPVARVYSIEAVEVVVPVADEELAWIDVPPGLGASLAKPDSGAVVSVPSETDLQGAKPSVSFPHATIRGTYSGRERQWSGIVRRTEGELDGRSRFANLVIEVNDPFADPMAPLLIGMFVDVVITGRMISGVRALPRTALRDANQIWIATLDSTLRLSRVEVAHRRGDEVLVYADLKPGERVVLSALHGVTDGMRIRVADNAVQPRNAR